MRPEPLTDSRLPQKPRRRCQTVGAVRQQMLLDSRRFEKAGAVRKRSL